MSQTIFRNAPTVKAPGGRYHHAAIVPAGGQTLYLAGQVGYAPDGSLPAGIEDQAENTYANIVRILEDAGMAVTDLVKLNIYLVNVGDATKIAPARAKWFGNHAPPGTLIYVKALAYPELLLEVEGVAVKHG